ncbi:error-prone DNA polymerase [Pseudorhodoplanes sp.]|uniref:error-prone DNA polymerase n=1 Tax=Pseudorhodoplanes sp. TaxID=1934341 RepID=UPI002B8656AC|nr:error-prone DNA polymerase [Pseudorhodoplanes sp.]HWV53171.1 error-prone DNA polymerase [Pseudorhodoplanes sp.]
MSNIHPLPARERDDGREAHPPAPPAYAEFGVTSNFSFLRAASHPEELVEQAKALGLAAIGIADRNSVAGVVRAHVMAKERNMRLVVGARLVFADGTPDILAYPSDRAAWGRLTQLLSCGKRRAEKGDCILHLSDLIARIEGLNLIVMPPARIDERKLSTLITRLKQHAAKRSLWLAASFLYRGDDHRRMARLARIATGNLIPLIATNDVLYHEPWRRMLQDIVTCIREHVTIDQAGRLLTLNAERHLKAPQEMARLFADYPDTITQTKRLLDRCHFSLDEMQHDYPYETRGEYETPQARLIALTEAGVKRRFKTGIKPAIRKILDQELKVIGELGYAPFFLTVHDIINYARSLPDPILCQGRGSAANSMICYCLGITEVSPDTIEPLFERFISRDRGEPPDIDVDFEHERREIVIQHIYEKYGRDHAGLAATVICYRGRSAVREVGKAFGLSEDIVSALASTLWGWSMDGVSEKEARRVGLDPSDPRLRMTLALTQELQGFPRHLSQHVGGFVITRTRLDKVVPIENATMEDRTVIEWDKDDLEALGLLKVDVLGLGMLSCLRRSFELLRNHYGVERTLSEQDEDKATYRMIRRADTIGVFQIESRAQMSMLPRLKPEKFYDLVIEVAIVRPGPIQGKMVHPYLQRRENPKAVTYPSPSPPWPQDELRRVLERTLGVPLFQEQAMRIAIDAAGFAPAEADKLRRAMATFKRVGTIHTFQKKMIDGMTAKGYARDFAERCFEQIKGFGEYGFPESHAASFANLVYASSWLKCHYPDVFAAALLNSQPMGFYAPAQIVRDAQEHGVEVRDVDVNASDWDCTLGALGSEKQQLTLLYPPPCGEGRSTERSEGDRGGAEAIEIEATNPTPPASLRLAGDPPHKGEGKLIHPRHAEMKNDIRTTHAIRLGFRQISGLSQEDANTIAERRGAGYDSIRDLWLRTGLRPAVLEKLANADAFRSLGLDRRDALWAIRALQRSGDKDDLPLFARVAMPEMEPDVALPPMLPGEQVVEDYRHLKLSLREHPVSFLRADLHARSILCNDALSRTSSGRRVTVAGIVLIRQRPGTAKGVIFMTLEDETGIANTIVWPKVFETFRPVVLGARLVSVTGKLQNEKGVIHVVADQIEDLTPLLSRLSEHGASIESLARCDEVKRPDPGNRSAKNRTDHRAHPRRGDALVRLLREQPELAEELIATHQVMPKGRNFH